MIAKEPVTNAIRLVRTMGIPVSVHSFDPGEEHLDAQEVAQQLQVDPDRVWKTLLARDEGGNFLVFVLPGTLELNLKAAARAAGVRKVELAPLAILAATTGYIRGGCSPLGMKKPFPTYLEQTAGLFDTILVSAGQRGVQMELSPEQLREACRATGCPAAEYADLTGPA